MATAPDDLYGLPFERFVTERDALAKELRAGGDREAADAVKKLAKPTRAAWAVNVAVRSDPDAARDLAESVRLLESAQEELLAGGEPTALRHATEQARDAIERLVKAAPAATDKVRETLHAALVEPEVLDEVVRGRVQRERVASGFGGLAGLAAAAQGRARPKSTPKPKPKPKAKPEKPAVPPAKLRRAKEAEAAAEVEVDAARRALEQVESAVARQRAELRSAEKRLADARRRRERAEAK